MLQLHPSQKGYTPAFPTVFAVTLSYLKRKVDLISGWDWGHLAAGFPVRQAAQFVGEGTVAVRTVGVAQHHN